VPARQWSFDLGIGRGGRPTLQAQRLRRRRHQGPPRLRTPRSPRCPSTRPTRVTEEKIRDDGGILQPDSRARGPAASPNSSPRLAFHHFGVHF
jgi:hypothetical protein